MPVVIDSSVAPEVYPLAWLVGTWRGAGVLEYPGIARREVVQTVEFDHDGGPYLRYRSTVWERPAQPADADADADAGGAGGADAAEVALPAPLTAADEALPVWSTETGYWRVAPQRPDGLPEGLFPVEAFLADPSGHVTLAVGQVGSGRIDLVSDAVARAASAAPFAAERRTYGLVDGALLWVWEVAALGQPLGSYLSASLDRCS